jgi:hypothetical protein
VARLVLKVKAKSQSMNTRAVQPESVHEGDGGESLGVLCNGA